MKKASIQFVLFWILGLTFLLPATGWCNVGSTSTWKNWQTLSADLTSIEVQRSFPYMNCFEKTAAEFDLPLPLLLAVARGESDFQPEVRSKKNCYGIMQIHWPGTAKDLGITRLAALLDPCTNIRAGGEYLRRMLDRYDGNIHLALAAYNYGPGRIRPGAISIPDGARWYSGYIYDHLQYVLASSATPTITAPPYTTEQKIKILIFNKPQLAENFLTVIRDKIPEMRFSWFHMGLGRFQVVMLHADDGELTRGRALLQSRLGINR